MSDLAVLKQRARHVWSQGDYAVTAARLEPAAERLVSALGIDTGMRVLDVAAGTGNATLAALSAGATVVASDLVPRMLELGMARTSEAGYDVEWVEADAEALPFEDASFDASMSVFGMMFAPRPVVAARELCRVVRPGGTVGMTAWLPDSFSGRLGSVVARQMQAPSDVPPTADWGRADVVRERFGDLVTELSLQEQELTWAFGSVDDMLQSMQETAPPLVAAKASLAAAAFDELLGEMRKVGRELARDVADGIEMPMRYLQVVGVRTEVPASA